MDNGIFFAAVTTADVWSVGLAARIDFATAKPPASCDAPLSSKANEITGGNGVYSLSDRFTDPHRIEYRSRAMKVIICGVNYLWLETTCFDNPQFPSPSLIYLRTTLLSLALLAWLSISASLPSRADVRNRDMSLQRHQVLFHHPIFALFFSCAVVCEADYF